MDYLRHHRPNWNRAAIMSDHNIDDLLYELRYASANEIGYIVAITAHCRNFLLTEFDLDCHEPAETIMGDRNPLDLIDQFINELNVRDSDHTDLIAVGMTVWWHTIRAQKNPKIRPKARSLWMELQRGVAYASDRALELKKLFGHEINIQGTGRIPDYLIMEKAE